MIIWIASYPKSGNTWLRSFLSTYFHTDEEIFKFEYLKKIKQFNSKEFGEVEIPNINTALENLQRAQKKIIEREEITFLKTHSSLLPINGFNFTNRNYTAGAVYIVRDPRNVITSLSNHYSFDFEKSLDFMLNSKKYIIDDRENNTNFSTFQFISSWSNNYKSWKNCKEFKILFIKYEDLENNQFNTFLKVIKFINSICSKKKELSNSRIKSIIESISFDLLKNKEQEEGFPESVADQNRNKISFFYLGKKNQWDKIYDQKKIEKLNNVFKAELIDLKYV
tara:strand:- start:5270 stop:6109 length:840 start_codon:yes stop_codon:yes gene_type:complete